MIIIIGSIKEQMIHIFDPVNDIHWPIVGLMMYRCLWHGSNVKPTMSWRLLLIWNTLSIRVFSIHLCMMCTQIVRILYVGNHLFVCMNVGYNCKASRFKRHSAVSLNWRKTAFVNTVYKFVKLLFSYTRVNAKLGFGKTSFVNNV